MPVEKIVLFHDDVSPANQAVREALESNGLKWTEQNIAQDAQYNQFIRKLCGATVSPVIYIDGKWLPDPTQEELLEALGARFDVEALASRGQTIWDVIVVGLGPAGLAACHGSRLGGLSVMGIDENEPGGHLRSLTDVDEYMGVGFDDQISGADIAENFAEHARYVGSTLTRAKVTSIRIQGAFKKVSTTEGDFYARAVVIATGAAQRPLSIDGVEKFINRGIRYGATVDANIYTGKTIAVVGGGNEALHAANFLSHHARHITVFCPDDQPSAEPLLIERAVGNGVRVIPGASIAAVKGGESLDFVFFTEKGIPEEQGLPIEAMVVALGPAPKTPIPGLEKMPQDDGYFAHGEGGKTMFGGIYVAGDCTNIETRTLMSVVASGSLCAKRLWQWLASHPLPKLK